jgi:hypothetical protein
MVVKLLKLCEFKPNQDWILLYRASRDGNGRFLSKCAYKSQTLIVIKSANGCIFGGYTNAQWDSSNENKTDPNAFIFSLVNPENKPTKIKIAKGQESKAIYCFPDKLSFGYMEMYVSYSNFSARCDLDSSYILPGSHSKSYAKEFFTGSSQSANISDYEVFQKI